MIEVGHGDGQRPAVAQGALQLAVELLQDRLAAEEAGQPLVGGGREQPGVLEHGGGVVGEEAQQVQLLGPIGKVPLAAADDQHADQPLLAAQGHADPLRRQPGNRELRHGERPAGPAQPLDAGIVQRAERLGAGDAPGRGEDAEAAGLRVGEA